MKSRILLGGCLLTVLASALGATNLQSTNNSAQDQADAGYYPQTVADDTGDTQEALPASGVFSSSRIQLNGFLSAGTSRSTAPDNVDYIVPERGTIGNTTTFNPNSLLGLQINVDITNKLAAVGQLVASGDNSNGNTPYDVSSSWAFLRYDYNPSLQIETGRFRMPLFIYSPTQQVGYSYSWIFLPNEVYRMVPFQDMNGITALYHTPLGQSNWTLNLQPFYGATSSQYTIYGANQAGNNLNYSEGILTNFNENNISGLSVDIGTQNVTWHAAYTYLSLQTLNSSTVVSTDDVSFYDLGVKATLNNWQLTSEYAHRSVPDSIAELTGYYASVGYRWDKLLPSFTYAHLTTDNEPSTEYLQDQDSFTLGINYYKNSRVMYKFSVSDVIPSGGDDVGLFTGDTQGNVIIYGAQANVIF